MAVSVALGTFDGLHKGHLTVLKNALLASNAICVTFTYPPNAKNRLIMPPLIKLNRLTEMGFKKVVSLNFDEVKDMQPLEFLEFLRDKYQVEIFCCGFDYRFGKNGSGDINLIKTFADSNRLSVSVSPPYCRNGVKVSSSNIRAFIENGEIPQANDWLSEPYSLELPVIHGDARGRTIGFPTLNQPLPKGICVPRFGVYISRVELDGAIWRGITNIGIRPTYLTNTPACETYVMGYKGDAYGKRVKLIPEKFIRDEEKFDSLGELKNAISQDMKIAEYY